MAVSFCSTNFRNSLESKRESPLSKFYKGDEEIFLERFVKPQFYHPSTQFGPSLVHLVFNTVQTCSALQAKKPRSPRAPREGTCAPRWEAESIWAKATEGLSIPDPAKEGSLNPGLCCQGAWGCFRGLCSPIPGPILQTFLNSLHHTMFSNPNDHGTTDLWSESVLEPRMPISNKLLVNSDVGDPQSSLWEPQDHFFLLDFQPFWLALSAYFSHWYH